MLASAPGGQELPSLALTQTLSKSTTDDDKQPHLNQEAESIYIGLLQLAGKIIDNFDIKLCEHVVEQKQLIDEIFVNFLFKSVFD